jgi:hypothetical protein
LEEVERTKERIKFYTEVLKIISAIFLVTAGGVATLIIKGWSTAREVLLTAAGILFILILGILWIEVYRYIKNLIR